MNYYTDQTSSPDNQYVSFQCQDYTRAESKDLGGEEPLCYDLDSAPPGSACAAAATYRPEDRGESTLRTTANIRRKSRPSARI